MNPNAIKLTFQPYSPPIQDLILNVAVGKAFPSYNHNIETNGSRFSFSLRSGHAINITYQVLVKTNLVAECMIMIETPYEKMMPKLKFHFEEGDI